MYLKKLNCFEKAYLNLLLNMSLQLLQLLCEGLLASGQLGHKGVFLLKLTTKLSYLGEDWNGFFTNKYVEYVVQLNNLGSRKPSICVNKFSHKSRR